MTYPEKKLTQAVILAAGKGTRMNSDLPKVLHKIAGKPMILYLLETLEKTSLEKIVVVVGYGKEQVMETVTDWAKSVTGIQIVFSEQIEQFGTGHAVLSAKKHLVEDEQYLLVLLGDVPFIKPDTISEAFETLTKSGVSSVVLSTKLNDPTGYGRIIRNGNGNIQSIIEEKDATDVDKKVDEVNTGIFIFNNTDLWNCIDELAAENSQKEYYLTDMVKILNKNTKTVGTYFSKDANQFRGINSKEQLLEVEEEIQVSS
ncbi:MAG: NTP transferase domain-containing protein [Leptospirales bacterium]